MMVISDLDVHLDHFLKSAASAKISSPFPKSTLLSILAQLTASSKCRKGVAELTMALSGLLWDDMVAGPETQRFAVPYAQ
ncbi:hypothetical protein SLEP1_g14513 [Rubroshorea leprosula]|uniref:Uncharacterized protein n=1 Tax=Rubroshorea leprosula TaxID=152421 RepID=A0AAV5ITS6_9ROSI|nr:hypothetical protein SLEP1_g14513 [Rubroshorea leprosula]